MESKKEYCPLCQKEVTFYLKPDPLGGGAFPINKRVWIDDRGHRKEPTPNP